MKELLKQLLPTAFVQYVQNKNKYRALKNATIRQMDRYYANYGGNSADGLMQARVHVIFYAHQIEKGLSHMNFRYGFGLNALKNLSESLNDLKRLNEDYQNDSVYKCAMDALHEYIERHEKHGYDIVKAKDIFAADIWNDAVHAVEHDGGSAEMPIASKRDSMDKSYARLAQDRHSVREYSDEPITEKEIRSAVDIAMRTPTVCNRQPVRVHALLNRDIISKALKMQGGFNGYETPPALLLITSDVRSFLNENERNEAFVDGGLFAMSLLLALEACGLAACPLNTMMDPDTDLRTRMLLNIPDNEFLVMYISVGHFNDISKICVSKRFEADDIISYIK